MLKILAFIFVLHSGFLFSQNFSFELQSAPNRVYNLKADIVNSNNGETLILDVDGDLDLDVLVIPGIGNWHDSTWLYINDGSGNYTGRSTTIYNLANSSADFADVDNDSDLDIILSGGGDSFVFFFLYKNDGVGNFTLDQSFPFSGAGNGDLKIFDADGDNDMDFIVCGESSTAGVGLTELYLNDGSGQFSLYINSGFQQFLKGDIAISDVDNDNDNDVFIRGENNSNQIIGRLYINDGSANFTESTSFIVDGIKDGDCEFADIDNDNDFDFLISGEGVYPNNLTYMYLNNGSGVFSMTPSSFIEPLRMGEIHFAHLNNDGLIDLIMNGRQSGYLGKTKSYVYINQGGTTFLKSNNTEFIGTRDGSICSGDVNNDSKIDLLFSGKINSIVGGGGESRIYMNLGSESFEEVSQDYLFVSHSLCEIIFGDVDSDGFEDLIINTTVRDHSTIKMLRNNGSGALIQETISVYEDGWEIELGDIDNDGDLDLLTSILDSAGAPYQKTKQFENDGNGNFTQVVNGYNDSLTHGDIKLVDIDHDGDLDLFHSGQFGSVAIPTRMYNNDGTGNLINMTGINIGAFGHGEAEFEDLNNDGSIDFVIFGLDDNGDAKTSVFLNDGFGQFTENTQGSLVNFFIGDLSLGDIDNDQDIDLIISGNEAPSVRTTRLYLNDGDGNFSETLSNFFIPGYEPNVSFIDFNNDNYLDIILTGGEPWISSSELVYAKIYQNNGNLTFNEIHNTGLWAIKNGDIDCSDIDLDGDLDLFLCGTDSLGRNSAKLYKNTTCNTKSVLKASVCNSFTWVHDGVTYYDSGIFQDVVPNSGGCDSTVVLDLTILKNRVIDTVVSCIKYTWPLNSQVYTISTLDSVIYTNEYGCDSIIIMDLTIDSIDLNIINNFGVLTSDQNNGNYQWLDCSDSYSTISGETGQNFDYLIDGFYAVQVTNGSCLDTSGCIEINTIGIVENSQEFDVKIYPNPVNGEFFIETQDFQSIKNCRIIDFQGKIIRDKIKINQTITKIEIQGLSGIYFLELIGNQGVSVYRLLIK